MLTSNEQKLGRIYIHTYIKHILYLSCLSKDIGLYRGARLRGANIEKNILFFEIQCPKREGGAKNLHPPPSVRLWVCTKVGKLHLHRNNSEPLLELPYDPVCLSVCQFCGRSVCPNFLKGREDSLL